MNIKGKSRTDGQELAKHLLNAETNEKITVVRIDGTVAQELHGAFAEMEAVASGTRCRLPLYHAKISPDPKEPRLTPEQWDYAVRQLAKELGMEGHAYAFVLHQKHGKFTPEILREHGHVVWLRINPDTMRTAHDGHNYRKHELVARHLEQEFGHARIQGAHVERDGQPRPDRTPPEWQMLRAATSGIDPREVGKTIKALWQDSAGAASFAAALEQNGLTLATGKRGFVVLDAAGDVHTLARATGLKAAAIRERMAAIDPAKLPTVEQARAAIKTRAAERGPAAPVWDRDADNAAWMDAVIDASIAQEKGAQKKRGAELAGGQAPQPVPVIEKDARLRELAEQLYQHKKPPELSADEREALKEKLAAFGFDPSKPGTLNKWQKRQPDVDAGRITEKDRLREMALYLWQQEQKSSRAGHSPPEPQRDREKEPDRDR